MLKKIPALYVFPGEKQYEEALSQLSEGTTTYDVTRAFTNHNQTRPDTTEGLTK